jgi:hypothetical protein
VHRDHGIRNIIESSAVHWGVAREGKEIPYLKVDPDPRRRFAISLHFHHDIGLYQLVENRKSHKQRCVHRCCEKFIHSSEGIHLFHVLLQKEEIRPAAHLSHYR